MASWRDSDDPRCPECGGKITATASYCMHCDAEFADDGSVLGSGDSATQDTDPVGQPVQGDDEVGQSYSDTDQVGTGGPDPDQVGQSYSDTDDIGQPDAGIDDVGQSSGDVDDVGQSSSGTGHDDSGGSREQSGRSSGGVLTSVRAALQTGSVKTGSVEPTTLLLRGPISVVMAFPVAVLLTVVLGVVGSLPGGVTGGLFLFSWLLGAVFLLQRPLASDAIGDAFYLYALVLVVAPLLWLLRGVVMLAVGASIDVETTVIAVVVVEMTIFMPAAFLVLLGYGCNYYARSRIESALGEAQ